MKTDFVKPVICLALVTSLPRLCLSAAYDDDRVFAGKVQLPTRVEWPENKAPLPQDLQQFRPFQTGPYCGPNALYLLLRFVGKDVTYEEVLHAFSPGEHGVSLADIKRVADHYGIDSELRKGISADSLASAPMPMILHVSNQVSEKDDAGAGHFILVTGITALRDESSSSTVDGIDSNNIVPTRYNMTTLRGRLSGYGLVLVPEGSRGRSLLGALCWTVDGVLVVAIVVVQLRRRGKRPPVRPQT
jgi:hypothetical protein